MTEEQRMKWWRQFMTSYMELGTGDDVPVKPSSRRSKELKKPRKIWFKWRYK